MDYSQCVQQISDKLAWLGKLGRIDSGAFIGIGMHRGDARQLRGRLGRRRLGGIRILRHQPACGWNLRRVETVVSTGRSQRDHSLTRFKSMKTMVTAIAAAGVLALTAVSIPNDAQAGCRGCGVGLGIVGVLAAGAIIGSAIANSAYPAYAVAPGYVPYAAY